MVGPKFQRVPWTLRALAPRSQGDRQPHSLFWFEQIRKYKKVLVNGELISYLQLFPWLFWYASELALKFWMAIICAGFPAYDHILDMSECLKTFGWFNLSLPRQVVAVAAAIVMVPHGSDGPSVSA